MENRNFYLCQRAYMGFFDGNPYIVSTIPGTEDDMAFAQGGIFNSSGEWVYLNENPQPICESRARLFESMDLEAWDWSNRCDCSICNGMI